MQQSQKRQQSEIVRRYGVFIFSLFFVALGVSLVTRSMTGTSPISSVPFVMRLNTPLSLGTYIFILNVVLMIGQMMMLGKKGIVRCRTELWMQIPVSIVFGLFVDMTMLMLVAWEPTAYWQKIASTVLGCACMAFGVSLEVIADVAMVSGEYFVSIASKRYSRQFGTVKIIFDVSLVLLAAAVSLLFAGRVDGLREGTIIVAVLTGPLVRLFMPHLRFIHRWQTKNVVESV